MIRHLAEPQGGHTSLSPILDPTFLGFFYPPSLSRVRGCNPPAYPKCHSRNKHSPVPRPNSSTSVLQWARPRPFSPVSIRPPRNSSSRWHTTSSSQALALDRVIESQRRLVLLPLFVLFSAPPLAFSVRALIPPHARDFHPATPTHCPPGPHIGTRFFMLRHLSLANSSFPVLLR